MDIDIRKRIELKVRMFNERIITSNKFAVISYSDNSQTLWLISKDGKVTRISSDDTEYDVVNNFVFGIKRLGRLQHIGTEANKSFRVTELYVRNSPNNILKSYADQSSDTEYTDLEAINNLSLPYSCIVRSGGKNSTSIKDLYNMTKANMLLYRSPQNAALINSAGNVLDISEYKSELGSNVNKKKHAFYKLVLGSFNIGNYSYYDIGYTHSGCSIFAGLGREPECPVISHLVLRCNKSLSDIQYILRPDGLKEALEKDNEFMYNYMH